MFTKWDEKGFLTQMKEYTKDMEIYEVGGIADLPGKNTPSGSWVRFKFPLEKNLNLRAHFQRFFNQGIRVGKILEIMDYVAATVAYKFCKEEPKCRKVTMVWGNSYFCLYILRLQPQCLICHSLKHRLTHQEIYKLQ